MYIYHGSKDRIETPVYGKGKPYNDYGLGFYCTLEAEMAKEWAVDYRRDGHINCYSIDDEGLSILDLNSEGYCILNWLAVLLENRYFDTSSLLASEAREYILENFLPAYTDFDIIRGYRADDSYFSFAQDFLSGTISYRQLGIAMKLGRLGEQYVLKSREAFSRLSFEGAEPVKASVYYPKRELRDRQARYDYFDSRKNPRIPGALYITGILDERLRQGDVRLR